MKREMNHFIVLLLLVSTLASAQQELDNYLLIAAENNPGLKAKFNHYLAALEVAPQVKALPDPNIAFAYFISPVETRVGPQLFKISASQMFPWFGTLRAKENLAIQSAKTAYEIFLEAKSNLFNEVRSTYYNIYINRRAIEITRENLAILGTFQRLANIKVKTGKVSAVDEYRIQMEMGDLENQLALLLDKQAFLLVMFNNLLNTESNREVYTPAILWSDDIGLDKKEVLDSIHAKNHQLLTLSLQQEALEYRKELAEKQANPNFTVGVDYTFTGKGRDNLAGKDAMVFPLIGISIPLYRNKYKALVNEVIFLQKATGLEKTQKGNFLETVLERGWNDYVDSDRRLDLYTSQLALAGQSLKLLETEYATSNMNFEEILRMERKQLTYALELERARGDKQAAISFINYLMGN